MGLIINSLDNVFKENQFKQGSAQASKEIHVSLKKEELPKASNLVDGQLPNCLDRQSDQFLKEDKADNVDAIRAGSIAYHTCYVQQIKTIQTLNNASMFNRLMKTNN